MEAEHPVSAPTPERDGCDCVGWYGIVPPERLVCCVHFDDKTLAMILDDWGAYCIQREDCGCEDRCEHDTVVWYGLEVPEADALAAFYAAEEALRADA